MQIKLIKATLIAASVAMAGGCATITPEQLEAVKATANAAAADANQAMGTANNALSVANEANITALEAQKTAETALACCNDNASKIDRAFTRAMAK